MAALRVLAIVDHYTPGWKAGGPVRAVQHLVEHLAGDCSFDILTADRDLRDRLPYPGLQAGQWHPVGGARVQYLAPDGLTLRGWREALRSLPDYDLVYLNSLFSRNTIRILLLRRLGLPKVPYLLATRGELQAGALSLNPIRKRVWLRVSRALRLYEGLRWQAATSGEKAEILRALRLTEANGCSRVMVAPDLPIDPSASGGEQADEGARSKVPGHARLVFVSRISRKKNLHYVLSLLPAVSGRVDLEIYGPVEDDKYWQECLQLIRQLPAHVNAHYRGALPFEEVPSALGLYHLFFFPTLGESFGHVIVESLLAGCPVLISDQTPWHDVTPKGAGWEERLDRPDFFVARLNAMVAMDGPEFQRMSSAARQLGREFATPRAAVAANRQLLAWAATGSAPRADGRTGHTGEC